MLKIDCHTHIVNEAIRDQYFAQTTGYAIVLEFLPGFRSASLPDNAWELVKNDRRLFLCPAIDLHKPLQEQLDRIEPHIEECRMVGLKLYLTYQRGRADDERLMPLYDFAAKYRLTVTYHTGSCSLVLPSENDMDGSNARYIAHAAERYPQVNFVAAHMDDPRFIPCIQLLHTHPNMFSDFSGAYEPGTHEDADMDWAIATFAQAIHQYDDTWKQMMYGTDFCPPINLSAIKAYDTTISAIFKPEQMKAIYSENCLRAYPRIKQYLKENHYEEQQ